MDQLSRKRGSLVRIKLTNFMTFSHCEFFPGPRMNVVLGPNGSGKSSLVCAICLGMGGTPQLLARASKIGGFVKQGCDVGKIEIELCEKPTNVIVERKISTSNNSDWRINGKVTSLQEVQALLRDMNIQVDNLCQFLPQDRVSEFAQFDEEKLLSETIRAVLGPEHLQLQKDISKTQIDVENTARNLEKKAEQLKFLEEEQKRNASMVERQKERVTLIKEKELLEKKLPWVRFEAVRDKAIKAKELYEQMQRDGESGENILVPLETSLTRVSSEYEKAKKEHDKAVQVSKEWAKDYETISKSISENLESIGEIKEELDGFENQKKDALKKVEKQKEKIEKIQTALDDAKGPDFHKQRETEINRKLKPLEQENADIQRQIAQIAAEQASTNGRLKTNNRKIQNLENQIQAQSQQKNVTDSEDELCLSKLKISREDAQRVKKFRVMTKNGEGNFKGKVFGPLICELRTNNVDAARALEFYLRQSTWQYFVPTQQQDQKRFMDEKFNCICIDDGIVDENSSKIKFSESAFKNLGIAGYLDDLLTCDPVAIEAARKLNKIQNVLVGSRRTEEASSKELEQLSPPANCYEKITIFTPNFRIEMSRSRYDSQNVSFRKVGLNENFLLHLPMNKETELKEKNEEIQKELVKLKEENKKYETSLSEIKEKLDVDSATFKENDKVIKEYKAERNVILETIKKEKKLKVDLENENEKLVSLEETANQDWEKKQEKQKKSLEAFAKKIETGMKDLGNHFVKSKKLAQKIAELTLSKSQFDTEKALYQELLKKEKARIENLKSNVRAAEANLNKLKAEARELKKAAMEVCEVTDEILQAFKPLPDDEEQILVLIGSKNMDINRISLNSSALAEYEKRAQQIQGLRTEISPMNQDLTLKRDLLAVQVDSFLKPVRDTAAKISGKVSDFFNEINKNGYGCAGEVSLILPEDQNVAKCGMEIKVRFRKDQPLHRLDKNVQSGGERSLTTFLYMLALQNITQAPFRVVDEINQGMDNEKERLAFYRLAAESSIGSSQYFMATPKLLPGLKFPKDATILLIFNGPFNMQQKDWNMPNFLGKKRVIADEEADDEVGEVVTTRKLRRIV